MDYTNMIKLPNGFFNRKDIETAAFKLDGFRPTQLRNLIAKLLSRGIIERVGHGVYVLARNECRTNYCPCRSVEVQHVSDVLSRNFPLLKCRVWGLSDMNEFLNHQIASKVVFVQVEKEGIEFVFDLLKETLPDTVAVLLSPNANDMAHYSKDVTVVVTRLASEVPQASDGKYGVALEQMAVDMFADRLVASMLPRGDYSAAIEEMFAKYAINESALFRYARRRGKEEELVAFFHNETNIELFGKDL